MGDGTFLNLDRRDLRFWALTFGTLLAAVTLVFALAFLLAPAGKVFSGFLLDTVDAHSYRDWTESFARGGPFVPFPTALSPGEGGRHFYFVWYLFGLARRFTGLPFLALWYGFGIIVGALLYLSILALMRELVGARAGAWFAYLLAGFGTGFGWIVFLVSRDFFGGKLWTHEFAQGDGFPIHAFWTFPHIAFSNLLTVLIYFFMYRAATRGSWKWASVAAGAALIMGFAHPFHFFSIAPVLACWYVLLTIKHGRPFLRRWIDMVVLALGMLPGILFHTLAVDVSGAAPNMPLGLPNVLLGYGPFFLLAILGCRWIAPLGSFTDRYLLVVIWAPVNLAMHLSYPLVSFSGRLSQGMIFPLAVLGTWGFCRWLLPALPGGMSGAWVETDVRERVKASTGHPLAGDPPSGWWLALPILFTLPSTLLSFHVQLTEVRTGRNIFGQDWDVRMTMDREEVDALKAMGRLAAPGSLVLSGPGTGLLLPGWAPVRVHIAHPQQTPDLPMRLLRAAWFYGPKASAQDRWSVLKETGTNYVWLGPDEVSQGGPSMDRFPFLAPVYGNGHYRIYEFRPGTPPPVN